MFESHHPIKKFSLDIIGSICEDLPQPIDYFISSGEIKLKTNNLYKVIVDDITLYENLLYVINSYYEQLENQGILIMNILGGSTLDELIHAMMDADLYENRLIARTLPKISAEGLLSLTSKSKFNYRTIMTSITKLQSLSVREIIQLLRDIKLTKTLSDNQLTSRKYWQSVEKIFSSQYKNVATLEVITLFAVK